MASIEAPALPVTPLYLTLGDPGPPEFTPTVRNFLPFRYSPWLLGV